MHPKLEAILDEAENRYLNPEELGLISQYVDSLPARIEAYRLIRDRELDIMQAVADQLQAALPQEKPEVLERSIRNALLTLRYCAMGMLLNDAALVQERLLNWLSGTTSAYNTHAIDTALYRLLNQKLSQVLTANQVSLFSPILTFAESELLKKELAHT